MPRQFGQRDVSVTWPTCPDCPHRHAPGSPCPRANGWLARGTPTQFGVVWIKRPMPDGQWPADQRLPRDDSYSWWVRSHCGHQGGAKQWAFHEEADADTYGHLFREDPCRWTRCPERIMIENDGRR
jgi:hypothetical protein